MENKKYAIFIFIFSLIPAFSDDDIIISETFGGTGGSPFSFVDTINGYYPNGLTISYSSRINRVGFTYDDIGLVSCGKNTGTQKSYIFEDNEFINLMKVCKVRISDYRVSYIYFKTNLNNEISGGTENSDCKTFEPPNNYAIVGFTGRAADEIDQIGCIYAKYYYNCAKLEEGKFCNYLHTEVLTIMPEGYFLNDTIQKTIDKCHFSCRQCINYGNEFNHNCSECISNYYPKIDNMNNCYNEAEGYYLYSNIYHNCYSTCKNCYGFGNEYINNCKECISKYTFLNEFDLKYNCYKICESYIIDKKFNKYECTSQGFSILYDSSDKSKSETIDDFDIIIQNKNPNSSYIIKGNNYTVFINPIGRYTNDSNVNIDFYECHKILKEKYPEFEFRILQINSENNNPNCLNEDVEYRVYNQFGEKIDLSCCENTKITIQNKIKTSLLNLEQISYFQNMGIDVFDLNDDFFNDICYPYFDKNNSDMILKDRVSDIYQNYSLCEKECEYELFNIDPLYVNCSCNVKQEVSNEIKEGNFKTYILGSFLYSNFGVIKCYKLVFGIKGKLKNIGFWLYGILILCHFPIFIYYCYDKINPIKKYIHGEMEKYEYKDISKKKEIINTIETTTPANIIEDKKEIKNKKKRKKSKFKKNTVNFPPKKRKKLPFYSETNDKIKEKKIDSKSMINIITNDDEYKVKKNINNKRKKRSNSNKSIKNFRNSFSSYTLNEGKKDELNKYLKRRKSLFKKNEDKEDKVSNKDKNKIINKNQKSNNRDFPLILINANNNDLYHPIESNYVLNNYSYNEAIINDKRSFFRIFFIYLISKENLLNLIFFNPPLELKPLRISIFIFNYICEFSLNALFYISDNISDNYHYNGAYKLLFSLINNFLISLASTLVNFFLLFIFHALIQSSKKIVKLFRVQEELLKKNKEYKIKEEKKDEIQKTIEKIMNCLNIKINLYIVIECLFSLFFYYYIIAFCHVYQQTQLSLLLDCIISYIISFIITILISFIVSILYKLAIKYEIKRIYNLIIFLYD